MPTFTRHDIENMGFKVAEQFRNGVSLHNAATKVAKDNQMNPEQIKRLVEAANTTAFLNEFKGKSGNQRMVEFDVADPDKVIDEALGDSSASSVSPHKSPSISITISVDPDSSLHDSVVDENISLPDIGGGESKTASYLGMGLGINSEPKETPMDVHKVAQVKESLLTKVADCNYRASDLADEIYANYKGIYGGEKYAQFEMDAFSLYGNSAIPALQMVRNRLGMDKIARTLSPQQEFFLSDRHVVGSGNTTNLTKLAKILDLVGEYTKLSAAVDYLDINAQTRRKV